MDQRRGRVKRLISHFNTEHLLGQTTFGGRNFPTSPQVYERSTPPENYYSNTWRQKVSSVGINMKQPMNQIRQLPSEGTSGRFAKQRTKVAEAEWHMLTSRLKEKHHAEQSLLQKAPLSLKDSIQQRKTMELNSARRNLMQEIRLARGQPRTTFSYNATVPSLHPRVKIEMPISEKVS